MTQCWLYLVGEVQSPPAVVAERRGAAILDLNTRSGAATAAN